MLADCGGNLDGDFSFSNCIFNCCLAVFAGVAGENKGEKTLNGEGSFDKVFPMNETVKKIEEILDVSFGNTMYCSPYVYNVLQCAKAEILRLEKEVEEERQNEKD